MSSEDRRRLELRLAEERNLERIFQSENCKDDIDREILVRLDKCERFSHIALDLKLEYQELKKRVLRITTGKILREKRKRVEDLGDRLRVKNTEVSLLELPPIDKKKLVQIYTEYLRTSSVRSASIKARVTPRVVRTCLYAARIREHRPGSLDEITLSKAENEERSLKGITARINKASAARLARGTYYPDRGDHEVLADYKSESGERIKVVTGTFVPKYETRKGNEEFRSVYSTRVYVNNRKEAEYLATEIGPADITYVQQIIEDNANGQSDAETLIASINGFIRSANEAIAIEHEDESRIDDRIRYLDALPSSIYYGLEAEDCVTDEKATQSGSRLKAHMLKKPDFWPPQEIN